MPRAFSSGARDLAWSIAEPASLKTPRQIFTRLKRAEFRDDGVLMEQGFRP